MKLKVTREYSFGIIPVAKSLDGYMFLAILRNKGFWEFPKGHAEQGESDIFAAKREFAEETGIEEFEVVQNSKVKFNYLYVRRGKLALKTAVYFLAFLDIQSKLKLQRKEVTDYRWVNYKDALNLLTYKNSRSALKRINLKLSKDNFNS